MRVFLIAVPTWILIASLAWAGDAVPLRYHFEPGEKIRYRITLQQTSQTNPEAKLDTGRTTSKTTVSVLFRLKETAGAWTTLEAAFDSPEVESRLDSLPLSVFGTEHLTEVHLDLHMGPLGLRDEPTVSTTSRMDAATWTPVAGLVESLRGTIAQSLPVLPEEPQAVGGTWRVEGALPAGLPGLPPVRLQVASDYRLAEVKAQGKEHLARLEENLDVSYADVLMLSGVGQLGQLKGQGKVSYLFAVERGRLLSATAELTLRADIAADPEEGLAGFALGVTLSWSTQLQ